MTPYIVIRLINFNLSTQFDFKKVFFTSVSWLIIRAGFIWQGERIKGKKNPQYRFE